MASSTSARKSATGSSGDLLADRRFAYAQACLAEGDAAGAAEMAEQALERAPRYAPAWFLLGRAREVIAASSGDSSDDPALRQAIRLAYATALTLDPDDSLGTRLHLARLGAGETLGAITPAYVRALFDGYAPRFERHLVESLRYRGPELILAALDALPEVPGRFRRVLDLGCGTGLMGRALASRADRLVGVDLSPAMLALARRTGVYERLVEGELSAFLASEPAESADLAVAADVLIYLGDLGPVFTGIARVLQPGAHAAVSVQSHDSLGIVLGPDGRYAHSEAHLREAARSAGLTIAAMKPAAVRRERGIDVPGHIAVLRKP